MDNYIKKHVDELYATDKTTFRDIDGEHEDFVVEFESLVGNWALTNNCLVVKHVRDGSDLRLFFRAYMYNEIKQLCIDYYGDE